MACIQPFRGVRPISGKVDLVTYRSHKAYRAEELNPFSFWQVLSPALKFDNRLAREQYHNFLAKNILQQDKESCIYIYQREELNLNTLGFFCACSVEDYQKGVIRKHENTIEQHEMLLADYLYTAGFSADPVLLIYPDHVLIEILLQKETLRPSEYDFRSADQVQHRLWKISDVKTITIFQSIFMSTEVLYIADGHHRCSAFQLLSQKRKIENYVHTGQEAYNFFMAYLVPESQITIHSFNCMAKDLNGLSTKSFLNEINKHFKIEKSEIGMCKPLKTHHFNMYLKGEMYSLHLRRTSYKFTNTLSIIDSQILYKTVLEPILGISDLRHDKRIEYKNSCHSFTQIKRHVDKGEFAVGFALAPLTIKEIKAVADMGLIMPPKSTYIEPKLHNGLIIYEF